MTVLTGAPSVGTYRWRGGAWRRWSGRRWARATYSPFPRRLDRPRDWATYPVLEPDRRERLLETAVGIEVLGGGTVVHRGRDGVVIAYPRKVTHLGHLVLTLLTGGLWGFVWIAVCLTKGDDRVRYEVDPWGNIWPFTSR